MTHLTRETLSRLVRGDLPRDEALAGRRHLGGCEACARELEQLEAHHEPERRLGRYVLLDEVGRGGMGQVLRGFDPQLDRFVALKRLLDTGGGVAARERLVREAQAMARVVHPNLVSVFDAGLDPQGEVYLVMEYVKGPSLAQWLTEGPRTWGEVVRCFRQAGQGLVAAHAAGLVHRDFKPSNVLVQDEVAKVTDFGLALAGGSAPGEAAGPGSEPRTSRVSSRVTEVGVNAGTPAYMAPEQFAGRFDARSDQYSFARSLEESLVGRGAPRWVHEVLKRALDVEPARRYPSMVELLEGLSPERRARRALAVGLSLLAVALLVAVAGLSRARRVDCRAAAAAGLEPVWSAAAQARLAQVLAPLEPRARQATQARFAAWAEAWGARSAGSCEASASGRQSEKLELLRRLCLERRLGFFGTVTGQLSAGVAAERLVSLELPEVGCTDEELLEAGAAEESETLRAQLAPVRRLLDEVEALALVGKLDEATARAREAVPLAEATQHAPTVAHASLMLGQRLSLTDPKECRRLLARAAKEAGGLASPSVFEARLAARASLDLLDTYALEPEAFRALQPLVEAQLARAGGGPKWEAAYLTYQGRALVSRGDSAGALPALRRAYALRLELHGPDSERTENARVELALALEDVSVDEALALRRTSLEVAERVYGPRSLVAARARAALGAVEVVAVRYADAEQHLHDALAVLEGAGATEDLSTLLDNLASLAELRGDFASSRPMRERLLAKVGEAASRAKQLALISRVLLELGDTSGARRAAEEARHTLEPINARHPDLIVALTTLGRLTPGADGERLLQRALTLPSASDGEYRGDVERALGERASGVARVEWWRRARESYASGEVDFRVRELAR